MHFAPRGPLLRATRSTCSAQLRWCSAASSSGSSSSSSSSSNSSGSESRLHSSDIAFKPNDDGWGYTKNYASNWDRIFAKNKEAATLAPEDAPKVVVQAADKRLQALDAARAVGALSDALYEQAKKELVK